MKRWFRRMVRLALAALVLLLIVIAVEIATGWRCNRQGEIHSLEAGPPGRTGATSGIPGYSRPEDDTFLSYPEWYIVWNYQEKADFQEHHLPAAFPYFGAVHQYWGSYCCISRLTRGKYSLNLGEQAMLAVIGTSFSAEYTLKGTYENSIGRFSEWTSGHESTEEDTFAYRVAREYADFVHVRPFYEFHFARRVSGLWSDTHLSGDHILRKWERKLFLTTDYSVEAFYCWIIEKLTHISYGFEPTETYAWLDNASPAVLSQAPRVKIVKQVGPKAFVVDIPRYQEFTGIAAVLARGGAQFVEIAGNSQILVSVLAPESWRYDGRDAEQLFSEPILSKKMQRVVMNSRVSSLSSLLNTIRSSGMDVEHIYDY